MSTATLEHEITSGFSTLDEDLYDAAIMDEFSLKNLVGRLAGLNERVQSTQAFTRGLLKPRTISLIRSVTSRARILAKNMMNIHRTTDEIAVKRGNQIAEVLARMSLRDNDQSSSTDAYNSQAPAKEASSTTAAKRNAAHTIRSAPSGSSSITLGDDSVQRSPLILKTLVWLLANIHDPYPSISRKTVFAASTGSSLKSVNNSFDTARRRIGWTKFQKKHFGGNRALALDCAHRVFVTPDPKYPVPDHIRQDLLDVKMETEKIHAEMLRNHNITEKACETIGLISTEVTSKQERNIPSEIQSVSQSVQPTETLSRASKRMLNSDDAAAVSEVRKRSESSILEPQQMRTSHKRRADPDLDSEEIEQGHTADSRPSKRKRPLSHVSSDSSDVSSSGLSTPYSSSPTSSTVFIASENPESLHPLPELRISDRSCADVLYDTTAPQSSRKRCHSDTGHEYAPLSKRPRNALSATVVSTSPRPVSPLEAHSFDWDGIVREGPHNVEACSTGSASAINSPRSHIGETSYDSDDVFNLVASGGQALTAEAEKDPLATLRPEDFGGDFAGFPVMPEFNIDWTDISPPSLESFLLPSDFFLSAPMPINFPTTDGAELDFFSGSASTLVDSSAFPSSSLDKPSLQPDIVNSESSAVLALMRDTASIPDIVQEMSRTARLT